MDIEKNKMEDEILGKIFSERHNDKDAYTDNDRLQVDNEVIQKTQKIVDRIELLQQMQAIDSQKALNSVKHQFRKEISRNWIMVLQRAAAVVLLPLLAFTLWQTFQINSRDSLATRVELSAPATLRSVFTLPDGTKVWLNGNSTLKYPTQFEGSERFVELSGEAYFEVAHNEQMPFIVQAENLLVRALGTEFNLCAYPNEARIEAVLTKGKVAIESEVNGNRTALTTLKPNQMIVYEKESNKIRKENVAVEKYTAWRDGTIVFKNDQMSDVLLRLGRWYNVEFLVDKNLKCEYSFTGSFQGEELRQILNYIELTTPIQFEIQKSEKSTNQIYLKTKIKIKPK